MKLRIALADDNTEFLTMFATLLGAEFEIVSTAVDGGSALDQIRALQPDVAILDLEMPLLNGMELTRELMKDPVSPAIVICSVETDPEIAQAAMEAGALAYVHKSRIVRDLVLAVKAAARGETFLSGE
jgi:DNA-binding NarL/FixJ family response regulator